MDETEIEKRFTSSSLQDIVSIYAEATQEDIVRWMKNRKTAEIKIHEIEGDSEVVVVIPTANVKSELAKRVAKLYEGLHIIFVESNGQYFNYARSVNYGVKHSLSLSPKWVVISNDDVTFIEDVKKLKDELSTVSSNTELVMASRSTYHTYPVVLVKPNEYFIQGMKFIGKTFRLPPAEVYGEVLRYRERLGVEIVTMIKSMVGPMLKFAGEVKGEFLNAGSFIIAKTKEKIMDETFINSHEDLYLSMTSRHEIIDYDVKEMRGASLGFGKIRFARTFVNEIYLNYLLKNSLLILKK